MRRFSKRHLRRRDICVEDFDRKFERSRHGEVEEESKAPDGADRRRSEVLTWPDDLEL